MTDKSNLGSKERTKYQYQIADGTVCAGNVSFEVKDNKICNLRIKGRDFAEMLKHNPELKAKYEEMGTEGEKMLDSNQRMGCVGNMIGWRKMLEGTDIDTIIERLEGIRCVGRTSSCPDSIAKALIQYKKDCQNY